MPRWTRSHRRSAAVSAPNYWSDFSVPLVPAFVCERAAKGYERRNRYTGHSRHCALEVLVHFVEEAGGRKPFLVGAYQHGKILGHEARLDGRHRDLLQRAREFRQHAVIVELGTVCES